MSIHKIIDNLIIDTNELDLEWHMDTGIYHYIDIKLDCGLISIENRPAYCDRGRYLVKVFSDNPKKLYIDDSDMFPRYYFLFDNLISEINCWIFKRNLNVVSVTKESIDNEQSKNESSI